MSSEEAALVRAGKAWRAAKNTERAKMARLYEAIRAAAASGTSEVSISKLAGLDRMTVRRALGKR